MQFLKNLFSGDGSKDLSSYQSVVDDINAHEEHLSKLSDAELSAKTDFFRGEISKGISLDDILPEAFAVVREAAKRTLGQRHYDVQLLGGIVLHKNGIAEMRTGEGKTLAGTLPTYLNALLGKGVHVVTVNDYLSKRDAVWMGQIYHFLGLSVGILNHTASYRYHENEGVKDSERDGSGSFRVVEDFLETCTKKEAYEADITYGTNSEFGFDYLRDNIAYTKEEVVQRPHYYAIVDEIDSILIDEARTPLIISAPIGKEESLYPLFARIVSSFKEDEDYTVDPKLRAVQVTDKGIERAEKALQVDNIYTDKGIKYVHHLETAIKAKALFEKDKEYVVREGKVIIVDTFTGRMQPGRRWSEGIHQAIEAKEGVDIQEESRTFASVTYQNYFRMYEKLAGMTGTAKTSAEEFQKVYDLDPISIPTNVPAKRIDHDDLIFQNEKGKYTAIVRKIGELHKEGRPVLIGTASIEKNELLSGLLKKEGIRHEMLNAKNHEREGEIIADAGKKGAVTVATNMAGRGVDIKLGGAQGSEEEYEEVKSLGGLYVLGTERHEARRIDNQLRGRAGRQGDEGETQFFVSLEDSLMRAFASDRLKNMMGNFGIPEDEPIANKFVGRAIESAQTKIEGFHFDSRKHVLEYDDVLNKQRQSIYTKRRTLLFGDAEQVSTYTAGLISLHEKEEEMGDKLASKEQEMGREIYSQMVKTLSLRVLDLFWMEHLESMEYMRSSVNLRAYGQRDPLVEYKKEGSRMFKELEFSIADQTIRLILQQSAQGMPRVEKEKVPEQNTPRHRSETVSFGSSTSKVGRNDPCPCGSGKKYKQCGLKETEEHKQKTSAQ